MHEFLRKIPLLSGLSLEDLTRLGQMVDEVHCHKGEYLFWEGDSGDKVFIIQEGEVEIFTDSGGQEITLAIRKSGEVIGEMSLIDMAPRIASGRAHTDCVLLVLTKERFDELLGASAEASHDILYTIIPRLRDTQKILGESRQEILRQSEQLEQALSALQKAHEVLEVRVQERTSELAEANVILKEQVAEREHAEMALASERNLLRTVIDNIPDYIYYKDINGEFVLNNLGHVRMLGETSHEAIIGKSDFDFLPQELAELYQANEQHILSSGKPIIEHEEIFIDQQTGQSRWGAATKVPLRDNSGNIIGLVGVTRDITERKQSETELENYREHLEELVDARTAELTEVNYQLKNLYDQLQQEVVLARRIQQSLLPSTRPGWANPTLSCYSAPAREVGGDFYAYYTHEPHNDHQTERFVVTVGDVSGKGMPAALLMAVSIASLQAIVSKRLSPSDLLTYLDLAIAPFTKTTHQNCALCCVELEKNVLRAANAGCIYPIIRRAKGGIEWVEVGGAPLGTGLGSQLGYVQAEAILEPGDLVILTSDGVVEANNLKRELFGFEQLEQAVASGPTTNADDMLAHLEREVNKFVGNAEPHDDLTVVVLQVIG